MDEKDFLAPHVNHNRTWLLINMASNKRQRVERLEDVEEQVNEDNGEEDEDEDEGLEDEDTEDDSIEHEVEPDAQQDNSLVTFISRFPKPAPSSLARQRVKSTIKAKTEGWKLKKQKRKQLSVKFSHLRVKEFPDNSLEVQGGELFCNACSKVLSNIKVSVNTHIKYV